jgi:transposase
MKRNAKNDVDALESIGIALGVRGASKKRCEATAHKLFARKRGKPIDLQTRQNVAMLLLLGELSYRSIAKQCRVSLGSITNIKKRIVRLMPNRRKMPSLQMIADALRDRKRCGGAAKRRKIGTCDAHTAFLRELLETHEARLQMSELCTLFERQFDVRVSTSTMHRFVDRQLDFTRQRVQRQLPRQALTERNLKWRQEFVDEWFTGADRQLIGTNDEQLDQRSNWRLRVDGERGVTRVEQLFWIDETGCNRHTLLRTHGYGPRGRGGVRCAGRFDGQKGRNHSVIIAVGAAGGVVARRVLVGSSERRGTRRDDFCAFLRAEVAPAMLASANAAGVDRRAPLYLMMDNASIHRGAVVSHALRSVSRRLHVAYQPPYMPTVNPVELVNNHLKTALRSLSLGDTVNRLLAAIDRNKKNKNKKKRNGSLLIDPLGGVVRNQAPIDDDEPLDKLIERVLDGVSRDTVARFVAHCGWR